MILSRLNRLTGRPGRRAGGFCLLRASLMSALFSWAWDAMAAPNPNVIELRSPGGRMALVFELRDVDNARACPAYTVSFRGQTVVVASRLGLELSEASLAENFTLLSHTTRSHDSTWRPVTGERAEIPDRYNQLEVTLKQSTPPHRLLQITFRAYDEGGAFCYTLPWTNTTGSVTVLGEASEFRFAGDHRAWVTYSAQGAYTNTPLSRLKPGCERPLVIQCAPDRYAALAEARLVDYARMKFAPLKEVPHALLGKLDGPVTAPLPLTSPWRVVMAAEHPGRMLENNYLLLNLNDPCALADTSWIKPGKVIREVTLTTAGGLACVDFAAKHGLQYVEFDAGWYGHEYDPTADASRVNVDPKRSKGPLDLPAVIRYANARGIGILLYVNHLALEKQLDQLFPLYRGWGIKGVKFGFVNVGSQRWTSWLHEAIRKAAAHQLMVDAHDEYRPTGYSRTFPNLMTVEGIRGDEARPPAEQTLTILFTRLLAGPADNTVCYFDRRVDELWSHAYQLAKPVCLFSPWQFLFWYDRPPPAPLSEPGAGNTRSVALDTPELAFYQALPTVWDETRVLQGAIGEYAVVARRRGADWFLGAMNATPARVLKVPLEFLERDQEYVAQHYSDDPAATSRTRVNIETYPVTAATVLRLSLNPNSGAALHLRPKGRL